MKASPAKILEYARTDEGRKKLRYAGVSVVFVPVGQVCVQVFGYLLDRNYTAGSLVTAAVLTLPNFFANKLYVWRVTSKENLRTQVLVFWVAAMLGTAMATGLTFLVQKATTDQSNLVVAVAVIAAQLTGFGLVWVGRFLILDKWLFKVTHGGQDPAPGEIDELHNEIPI
jgi:putative flippase GtrA